jgi:hypothetical protein
MTGGIVGGAITAVFSMTVPAGAESLTRRTRPTVPLAPAGNTPIFQLTVLLAESNIPPLLALTNVVLAGTGSVYTTLLATPLPILL